MITLIHGTKGSGKTKRIIDSANAAIDTAKGTIVYITDKSKHSIELNLNIRFIDVTEHRIDSEAAAIGFIKGILACDNDIEKVYIDGLARIAKIEVTELKAIYEELAILANQHKIEFITTVSCATLPEFLTKYQ